MKYLIIGCNGMAGHLISIYLKEQGHKVVGIARNDIGLVETIELDARQTKEIEKIINENCFDVIVNCIGILNHDAEDKKEMAVWINSYFPHWLEFITKSMETQVIHLSTDCVFSGKKGGYTEDEFRDGESFYDRTKALGEIENTKDLTIRSSIIGPDLKKNGIGLLNWFLLQNRKVNGYSNVFWTGQTTLQLAKTIEQASRCKLAGLINLVPSEKISKYDLLCLFNKYIKKEKIVIEKYEDYYLDKSLIRTKGQDFDYIVPGYEQMVIELAEWMSKHRELYPHYYYEER